MKQPKPYSEVRAPVAGLNHVGRFCADLSYLSDEQFGFLCTADQSPSGHPLGPPQPPFPVKTVVGCKLGQAIDYRCIPLVNPYQPLLYTTTCEGLLMSIKNNSKKQTNKNSKQTKYFFFCSTEIKVPPPQPCSLSSQDTGKTVNSKHRLLGCAPFMPPLPPTSHRYHLLIRLCFCSRSGFPLTPLSPQSQPGPTQLDLASLPFQLNWRELRLSTPSMDYRSTPLIPPAHPHPTPHPHGIRRPHRAPCGGGGGGGGGGIVQHCLERV